MRARVASYQANSGSGGARAAASGGGSVDRPAPASLVTISDYEDVKLGA